MIHRKQQGIVMPIILLIMMTLSVLGLALLMRWNFDARVFRYDEDKMQAHYLARSGAEIAKSLLNKNPGELPNMPFYFYGSIQDGFSMQYGNATGQHEESSILVSLLDTGPGQGQLTATGRFNGAVDTLSFDFDYGLPATGNPPIPDDSISAGPDGLRWINNGEKLNKGGFTTLPVRFASGNDNVITLEKNSLSMQSPAIFFIDPANSLEVTNNSTLSFTSDFIAFYGTLSLDQKKNNKNGNLVLHVLDSTLSGKDIPDPENSDTIYGVIYFGAEVNLGFSSLDKIEAGSYYYFPDGLNLREDSDQLIKIDQPASIDLDKLGMEGIGGISTGTYK